MSGNSMCHFQKIAGSAWNLWAHRAHIEKVTTFRHLSLCPWIWRGLFKVVEIWGLGSHAGA